MSRTCFTLLLLGSGIVGIILLIGSGAEAHTQDQLGPPKVLNSHGPKPVSHINLRPEPSTTTRPSSNSSTTTAIPVPENEDPAVTRFREFLRIDTSHPNPNYEPCVQWLQKQATEIGLEFRKISFPPPALFALRLTWVGSNPKLKSIMLNSHIDVVPVDRTKWRTDPFAATKDSSGNIYARGAQDRKSLGVQYLEAVRRLKSKGYQPLRTIHLTYVPDEELGGFRGMKPFVESEEFGNMNIGLELDEGGATPGADFAVYYGERTPWQFKVIATGRPSHAALMFEDNAAVKLQNVISRLLSFRANQIGLLKNDSSLEAGDVTSINLSQLGGGLQPNIVPSELWAIFDMRIKVEENWTFANVTKMLDDACAAAGPGVRYEFILKSEIFGVTKLEDSNIWWKTFKDTFDSLGVKLSPKFFPGATDARYLRNANYTALGFCPLPHTEPLQHQDNEFLNENTFLQGIQVYETLLPRLANVDPSADSKSSV